MAAAFTPNAEEQEEVGFSLRDTFVDVMESASWKRYQLSPNVTITEGPRPRNPVQPWGRYDTILTITHEAEKCQTTIFDDCAGEMAFVTFNTTKVTTYFTFITDGTRPINETRYWRFLSREVKKEEDFDFKFPEDLYDGGEYELDRTD